MTGEHHRSGPGPVAGRPSPSAITWVCLLVVLWAFVCYLNLNLVSSRLLHSDGMEAPPVANRIAAMVLVYGPLLLAWAGYRVSRPKGLFVTVTVQFLLMPVALLFWLL